MIEYERTGQSVADTETPDRDYARQYILILTDENHNLVLPGEILALTQYLTDILLTKSANQLHPLTDNYIVPTERLHVTPQTIAGLHALNDDLNGKRVPLTECTEQELTELKQYMAVYRTPTAAPYPVEYVDHQATRRTDGHQ